MRVVHSSAIAFVCLAVGIGCGSDSGRNTSGDGGNGTVDADPNAPDAGPPPMVNDGGQPLCTNDAGDVVVCECADGIDNDGDGQIDAGEDLECAGPYDNDEATFGTGIPGDNMDPFVQDCFFDGDSGGGNDGCRWDIRCLEPPDGQHCNNNDTSGCAFCLGLTPNGCDCFGCCDVYVDTNGDGIGEPFRVRIQDECTAAVITDPNLCPPCDFVLDCYNPCDPCEYCIGHEPEPGCTDGPCPEGVVPCDVDGACPDGTGCITGCCQPIIQ